MQEKVIIKSERINLKKTLTIIAIVITIGIAILIINDLGRLIDYIVNFDEKYSRWYNSPLEAVMFGYGMIILISILIADWIISMIILKAYSKIELTVTDKRAYGTSIFEQRVDLPLDSITAIGTSIFKGIAITTPSGVIRFAMIKNRDEIHSIVSKLLIERQGKATNTTTIKQEIPQSNADELKKYKELVDNGVISQEEFDAKKKQLLGL